MIAKKQKSKSEPEIELRLDGWERFERAVGAAVKSGPKHKGPRKPSGKATKKPGK